MKMLPESSKLLISNNKYHDVNLPRNGAFFLSRLPMHCNAPEACCNPGGAWINLQNFSYIGCFHSWLAYCGKKGRRATQCSKLRRAAEKEACFATSDATRLVQRKATPGIVVTRAGGRRSKPSAIASRRTWRPLVRQHYNNNNNKKGPLSCPGDGRSQLLREPRLGLTCIVRR